MKQILSPQTLFPSKNFFEINLDAELKNQALTGTSIKGAKDKQTFITKLHEDHAIKVGDGKQYISYGGWGEDRSFMWADTYMSKSKTFTHLGVDINVPKGTSVTLPFDTLVVDARTDPDTDVGWGTRLVVVPINAEENPAIVLGHLAPEVPTVGTVIGAGAKLATIGTFPENGNVFEHLHIQLITPECIRANTQLFETLDGYGFKDELKHYPDPLATLFTI